MRIYNPQRIQLFWCLHSNRILKITILIMFVVSILWLGYEFWRLLWENEALWPTSPTGAVDLKRRYLEVHNVFSHEENSYPYPPASYSIFWLFTGWLDFTTVRREWAIIYILSLVWLIYLIVKESYASNLTKIIFVALLPLSMYATGATIGNGQLIIQILPLIIYSVLLLKRSDSTFKLDLLVSILFLLALAKPNISAPFMWIIIFIPGRFRPALLIIIGYITLTAITLRFSDIEFFMNLQTIENSATWASQYRYLDIPNLLLRFGLKEWIFPVTLILLFALGLWIYLYRKLDVWLLMSVCALTSKFLIYHRWYDDLLVLLPLICLFRISQRNHNSDEIRVLSGLLIAISVPLIIAPGGLYLFPYPLNAIYSFSQSVFWIIVLIFLIYIAKREKTMQIPR